MLPGALPAFRGFSGQVPHALLYLLGQLMRPHQQDPANPLALSLFTQVPRRHGSEIVCCHAPIQCTSGARAIRWGPKLSRR